MEASRNIGTATIEKAIAIAATPTPRPMPTPSSTDRGPSTGGAGVLFGVAIGGERTRG